MVTMNVQIVNNMKHLITYKNYLILESNYSKEEYYDYITRALSNYNISPVQLRTILDGYEEAILDKWESGEDPKSITDQLISDMELDNSGGYLSRIFPRQKPTTLKYL